MDIINLLISNKISSSKKSYECFNGYANEYKTKPFTIILPKTSTYVKSYDGGAAKWNLTKILQQWGYKFS